MAAVVAPLNMPSAPPQADYPALFVDYVVRGAAALCGRLAATSSHTADEFARLRDHALHLLTFALGPDAAWPAARDLLLTLAEPMELAGARSEWLPFLTRGVERSMALADAATEAELSLRIGHLLRLVSDFAAAQQWMARGLYRFEHLGDSNGVARALNQLAYVDCLLHHDEEAVARAANALTLLAEDEFECAMSYFVLGMVAINRWEWVEAEAQHRTALAIRQSQGDRRRIAWAQQNVGYALQGQRRYAEAIDCFCAAATTLDELGDKANRAIVLMNLARTYHLDGQFAQALATHQLAQQALRAVGDRLHAAVVAVNLGITCLALEDPRAALAAFQESAAIYSALANAPGRLNATSGVAIAHLALADYAAAAAELAPALEELAQLENVPGKAALYCAMTENLDRARSVSG